MVKPYYQDKWVTIYHGDCREILPSLPKVDLVLTDPPYGIGEAAGKNKSRRQLAQPKDYGIAKWDDKPIDYMDDILSSGKYQIVFGGNFYEMPASSCWLVWDKQNTGDFADCELAWTNLKKAVRKFEYQWNGMLQGDMKHKETRYHPTQKPLPLMKWCITQVKDVQTILDPFMGSGTTCLASKILNKYCTGIEIEERYCEIAARRCSQEVMELGI